MEILWRGYIRCRLLASRKHREEKRPREENLLAPMHRSFSCMAEAVERSCALWEMNSPRLLAEKYMAHVLAHEKEKAWWDDHLVYLDQPWFIRRYCLENHLAAMPHAAPAPLPLWLIRPEKGEKAWVTVKIMRDLYAPETGVVFLECAYQEELLGLIRKLHFSRKENGYSFRVDECLAPVDERAVEYALELLGNGYGVAVEEKMLEKRILSGKFMPAHGYWIKETERPDYLRLIYPYDRQLHRYLCILGARWEKKQMLLPISCADCMPDIIRLYDFRMTREAKRRLDLWEKARAEATVFRPRRGKNTAPAAPVDRFREMLKAPPERLADLEDEDE